MDEKIFLVKTKDYLERVLPEETIKSCRISDKHFDREYHTLIISTVDTSIYISYNYIEKYSLVPGQHYLLIFKLYSGKLMYVIDYVDPPVDSKSTEFIISRILDFIPGLSIPKRDKEVILPTDAFRKYLVKLFNTSTSDVYIFEPTYIRRRASSGLDTDILITSDSIYDITIVPICDYGKKIRNKKTGEDWKRISAYTIVYTDKNTRKNSIRYLVKDLTSNGEYFPSDSMTEDVRIEGNHKNLLIGSLVEIPIYFSDYFPICAKLLEIIPTSDIA